MDEDDAFRHPIDDIQCFERELDRMKKLSDKGKLIVLWTIRNTGTLLCLAFAKKNGGPPFAEL